MMLLRHRLQTAVLSLLVSSSTALNILSFQTENLRPDPNNTTNSSPEPEPEPGPGHPPNLTYAPWPPQPYEVPLHIPSTSADLVIIRAREFHGSRPVSVSRLQAFLLEFRENLEREYPIPSLVPRLAKQSIIDIQSYTAWKIEIDESLLGRRMSTATALVALGEMGRQLGRYGPANMFFSVKERYSTLSLGYLEIMEFGGGVLNGSLVDGDSAFQIT